MAPRILDVSHCPHCRSELARPPPRMCPACGGSLQKRFLTAGCLSSAPKLLLIAALGALALRAAHAWWRDASAADATHAEGEAGERGVAKPPARL